MLNLTACGKVDPMLDLTACDWADGSDGGGRGGGVGGFTERVDPMLN